MAARLFLANGRLIDGTGAPPRDGWSVGLDGGVIDDADPALDVRILCDKSRIVMIVQDGRVVKDSLTEVAHGV